MKFDAKRISKKVLSLILTLCLVFTTMAATLSVFAEDAAEIFQVSYSAPAIPMDALTVLSTENIMVETENGEFIGNTLTYNNVSGSDGIEIDNTAKTITAYKKGNYKVEAFSGNVKVATLYVTVKNASDEKWVLYETDFTIGDSADFAGWSQQAKDSSTVAWTRNETLITDFSIITSLSDTRFKYVGTNDSGLPISDDAFNVSWNSQGGVIVLDNEVVRNFSDYTITSDMYGMSGSHSNTTGFGIFGRVNMPTGDTATLGANMALKSVIYNFNGANNSNTLVNNLSLNTANGNVTLSNNINPYTAEGAKPIKMVYTFSGNTLSAKFGNGAVVTVSDMNTDKGVVGVYSGIYSTQYFAVAKTFSVALNNVASDKPLATTLDVYTVNTNSPAIPMDALTVLPFRNIAVATADNTYLGSDLTYTNVSGTEGIIIDNTAKTITAYKKGNYKVEAFSGSEKVATLYVTVKNASDTEWVLYESGNWQGLDTTGSGASPTITVPENWKIQHTTQNPAYDTSNYVSINAPETVLPKKMWNNQTTGITPIDQGHVYSDSLTVTPGYGSSGFFTLNDDIVSDFADYTMRASAIHYAHGSSSSNFMIYGRTSLVDGQLATGSSLYGFTASGYLITEGTDADSNGKVEGTEITGYHRDVNFVEFTGAGGFTNTVTVAAPAAAASSGWNGNCYKSNTTILATTAYRNYVLKFDGSTATFYDADLRGTDDEYVFTYNNVPVQKGAVGLGIRNHLTERWLSVKSVEVALNNAASDKPVAEPLDIYTVQTTSPAIPMNSFTVLPFKNFAVATDTNTYLGDDLTYTNVSGKNGIVIDNDAKTFTATKKGNYKVEAYSGDTLAATLYVTVKDATDDKWYLYNTTFGNYSDVVNTYDRTVDKVRADTSTTTDVSSKTTVNTNTISPQYAFPTGWRSQIYSGGYKDYSYVQPYKFTFTTTTNITYEDGSEATSTQSSTTNRNATANGIVPFGNSYASIGVNGWASPAYFVLNDETVNAFADYTITSAMQSYNHQGWDVSNRLAGNGIFGRAVIGADGGMSTTGSLQGFTAVNSNKKVRRYSLSNTTLSSSIIADGNSTQDWAYLSGKQSANAPQNTPTEITLSVKFDGTTASFWSDKDTNKQTYTITDATVQKGAVGIMAGGTSENLITHVSYVNVRTFSVALNNAADDLPDATALQLYTVSDNSPAIPMNVNTAVDTNNLIISLGGTNVHGADITYTPDETAGITIENGIITANAKGSYRVKVEADGETDYIWVVVKNRTDKEFVLYETDFSNEATLKEWQASFYDGTGTVKKWGAFPQGVNYLDQLATLADRDKTVINTGWSPFAIENGVYTGTDAETSANVQGAWGQKAIFYSTHEVFKQFSDYTVNVDYWSNSSYHGGDAMIGRINLNSNNLVDTSSTATGMYINCRYSINTDISGAEDVRANVFAFNGEMHTILNHGKREYNFTEYAIGYPFNKYLGKTQRNIELIGKYNVTTIFDGENITMYSEGDYAGQVFTTTTDNTGKGSFGIGLSCFTASNGSISKKLSVNSVKVTLNATDADLPPFTVTDGSYLVPVNNRLNLNTLPVSFGNTAVMGSEVEWTEQRDATGQLLNNTFIAFSEGDAELIASYNGKTTTINVSVVANGSSANVAVEAVAGNDIKIAPAGDKATQYKVTITPPADSEVRHGSLVINDDGRTERVITSADNTGLVYGLETALLDRAALSVEYNNAADNTDLYSLGATVRIPNGEKTAGIRFGARSSVVRLQNDNKVYLQDRTLDVDGVQYTLSSVGMLVIPEAIMGDELTVETKDAANKTITSVIDDTSLYSDYVVTLALPTDELQFASARKLPIVARPYMLYKDADGNEHYVYGDIITRSYDDVLDRTPSPDVVTVNGTNLSEYKLIVDTANADSIFAANRINDYLRANTGYTLNIADDGVAASDYEIIVGETSRKSNEITEENKYKGYSDGNKFYIFFGDEQAAEMAADDFCDKLIGKENANYENALKNMANGVITMNVDTSTPLTFAGQWDEIQRFAVFADTHIGRYEKGTAWYAEYDGTNPTNDYYNNPDTYNAALQNSHGDLIQAFKHVAYLDSTVGLDYMTIVGDITETGYNYNVDESKLCWDAYEFVLNQAFGGLDENASAYSVAINGLKTDADALPIYDVVGNHDTWNGSGTYEISSSDANHFVKAPTDDTQFIRDRIWYSSDVNGKKVANISFNGSYSSSRHTISDTDLAELEASLKAASEAGATQIMVYNHFAMYPYSSSNGYYSDESYNKIAALLHKYGAQIYMSGHYHHEYWLVENDGYTNYIDIDSTMNNVSHIYNGTYAVVTVTDRRIRYDIYESTYTETSGAKSGDFATKTPVKTITLNLFER